jgi:hypothetical protein
VKVSRRSILGSGILGGGVLAGALAVPTVAGLSGWQWRQAVAHPGQPLLLFDPSLDAGQRFARTGEAAGGTPQELAGDPVRLMQGLLAARPALIAGISRHADAVLAVEAAQEAGYVLAGEMLGDAAGCSANTCHAAWVPLTRMAVYAGANWAEALAAWAQDPQARTAPAFAAAPTARAAETALGWVLVPR